MRILFIALCLIFLGHLFSVNSDAATVAWPTSHPSLPEIHMQVSVRNSNGDLIAYYEPKLWYISDVTGLHALLDTKSNKVVVYKDGTRYERIKFTENFVITSSSQITSEPLYYDERAVLMPRHDGIIAKSGYLISVSWNILRS